MSTNRKGPPAAKGRKAAQAKQPRYGARQAGSDDVWLFGLHAVRDALGNPLRVRRRLIVTPNAQQRLEAEIARAGIEPEVTDPRKFDAPLDPQSVHQGAAMLVSPLDWGPLEAVADPARKARALVVCLDRVTDPHNVGAILRSAEVFGSQAVIAPRRHAAPETGALAKSASGALERQPYLRVANLGDAMQTLAGMGYRLIGLDGAADLALADAVAEAPDRPLAMILGAEGPGLRERSRSLCHRLARIEAVDGFGSLNVSNAAAVALYAASRR